RSVAQLRNTLALASAISLSTELITLRESSRRPGIFWATRRLGMRQCLREFCAMSWRMAHIATMNLPRRTTEGFWRHLALGFPEMIEARLSQAWWVDLRHISFERTIF